MIFIVLHKERNAKQGNPDTTPTEKISQWPINILIGMRFRDLGGKLSHRVAIYNPLK